MISLLVLPSIGVAGRIFHEGQVGEKPQPG
jgi:hypothetical protein